MQSRRTLIQYPLIKISCAQGSDEVQKLFATNACEKSNSELSNVQVWYMGYIYQQVLCMAVLYVCGS